MNEHLVISLDRDPDRPARWVVVDQTGAVLSPPAEGPLGSATALTNGRQVIGLLPATDVLRTHAEVPVKGAARVLQALPFALEEQLAEDVDALHFAAGSRAADGRVPVAIVRRDILDSWVARCTSAGFQPDRLYGEGDALGGIPNTTALLMDMERAVLAAPDGTVAAVDGNSTEALLDLWLAKTGGDEHADTERAPRHLVVYCPAALAARLEPLWHRLRSQLESVEVRAFAEGGALPRLAANIVTSPGVNLLQGAYARRSALATHWPAWRLAAGLLMGFVVAFLAVEIAEVRQLRAEVAALDQSIEQAFRYVFPDAGPLRDARAQLNSRLKQLGAQGDGGSREFLDALKIVAEATGAAGQAQVEGLSYRSGVMELRLRAPTVEVLDRIQQVVSKSGNLRAEIQSANASGNEVLGRIQISRAGS